MFGWMNEWELDIIIRAGKYSSAQLKKHLHYSDISEYNQQLLSVNLQNK